MIDESSESAADVEIFEPLRCCPTGLCGPVVDQGMLDLLKTVRSLEYDGVRVARYEPTSNPSEFMDNVEVMKAVRTRSMSALPITCVNGAIVKCGAYPTVQEIRNALKRGGR